MDEVDIAYRENIRSALDSKNIERLAELVGDYDYAYEKMQRYQELSERVMGKVRAGNYMGEEAAELVEIIDSCLSKANLSGFRR